MKGILEKTTEHDPGAARIVFMEVLLKLLGYKYRGNGIESGCYRTINGVHVEYWFHDDGTISYSENDVKLIQT